ncbi:MAG: hypothetical protein AAF357_16800, partial [Verrucomicrobiota bacterium]
MTPLAFDVRDNTDATSITLKLRLMQAVFDVGEIQVFTHYKSHVSYCSPVVGQALSARCIPLSEENTLSFHAKASLKFVALRKV